MPRRSELVDVPPAAAALAVAPTIGRLYQGVARSEFGFKMLQAMGWVEGKARV